MTDKKYRLVTRADFDGVVSGTLLLELDMIDDIEDPEYLKLIID